MASTPTAPWWEPSVDESLKRGLALERPVHTKLPTLSPPEQVTPDSQNATVTDARTPLHRTSAALPPTCC